jgi:uncharacterized repeat protein (TIGR01451 family)
MSHKQRKETNMKYGRLVETANYTHRTGAALLAIVAAIGLGVAGPRAFAASHATSTNVAVIPSYSGQGWAGDINPADYPVFMSEVDPSLITSAVQLAAYDTIILNQFCYVADYPAFTSALVDWLRTYSGKLLIWDSDSCNTANGTGATYQWLTSLGAQFDLYTPGQTGAHAGSLVFTEVSYLGGPNPASPYFIDTTALVQDTDAVGDVNVVNVDTVTPVWCALMRGTNVLKQAGYAHMYTQAGGLIGAPSALIIYCGLDTDDLDNGSAGGRQLIRMLQLELIHGWGSAGSPEMADLRCGTSPGNLILDPKEAYNLPGEVHTVTARAIITLPNGTEVPQPGVTVKLAVTSGPNVGGNATGVTDAAGQAAFSYTGTEPGTDVIEGTATFNGKSYTNTVVKYWADTNDITLVKNNDIQGRNIGIGQQFTYVISFATFSNDVAAANLRIIDKLPTELDFVAVTTNGALSASYIPTGPGQPRAQVIWSFGTWPALAWGPTNYLTVRVNGSAAPGQTIINIAEMVSDNLDPEYDIDPRPPRPCTTNCGAPPVAICQSIIVSTDPGQCTAAVTTSLVDGGSSDPDGDALTFALNPAGPYPIGDTPFTLTVADPSGLISSCQAVITVVDSEAPVLTCPANIVQGNDPGQCSAVVSYVVAATDNCTVAALVCDPPSGSTFAKGTTPVACAATDAAGNASSCSFTVTVEDREAPRVACRPAPNPAGKKIPLAGKNPKSGQNPDGFYQLLAKDNCDPNPKLYIKDPVSKFVAGPFASGDIVKIVQAPDVVPNQKPGTGVVVARIQVKGDARLYAVDAAGNVSPKVSCLVPPPPK